MKLLICLTLLLGIAHANETLYAKYAVRTMRPISTAIKIDWSKPENKKAQQYKTAFEQGLARVKAGQSVLLGQRYVIINPGCGSECQVIGYFDTVTGKATLADFSSSYEVSYRANSTLLVVNPPETIEQVYGSEGPGWLKTEYYNFNENGLLQAVKP